MKKVIREGVFETNSSSTHSVVFKRRKNDLPDKKSSYELHTPFAKTLFIIGLYNHAVRSSCFYSEEEVEKIRNGDFEDYYDNIHQFYADEYNKGVCEKFKNAVINEYILSSGITKEEFDKQFNESNFTCDGNCYCHFFFGQDVLNDCTCPFYGFDGIIDQFKLNEVVNDEDYTVKAKLILSPNYKFVLKEFWNGFCLIEDKEIF